MEANCREACIGVSLEDYALAQALGTLEHRAPRVRSGMYRVDVQRRTLSTGHTVLIEMAVLLRHVEDMTTRYQQPGWYWPGAPLS